MSDIIHPRDVMDLGRKKAEHYWSTHRVDYERPIHTCYRTLEVVPFLKGQPWNEEALAWLASLRPSCIRVTLGETKTDAISWRVTVYMESDRKTIRQVVQEVVLGGEAFMKPVPGVSK